MIAVDEAAAEASSCLRLYRRLASGVSVISVADGGQARGMTASSVTSVSLDPPLLLVAIASTSATLTHILRQKSFGVNLLNQDSRSVAERFATRRATELDFLPRPVLGVPVLADPLAWAVCLLEDERPCGDHHLVIGRIVAAHTSPGRPLVWHDSAFAELLG